MLHQHLTAALFDDACILFIGFLLICYAGLCWHVIATSEYRWLRRLMWGAP